MNLITKSIVVGSLCLAATVSHAIPMEFDLSGANSAVNVNSSPLCAPLSLCGAIGSLADDLDAQVRPLDVGDSWTFDFFNLSFWGFGVGTALINATLAFDLPVGLSDADSLGVAGYATAFGAATGLVIGWDPIAPIQLSDGSYLQVEFEAFSGINVESDITVHATLTRAPAAEVPEPATLGIMGLGAILLSQLRRKRS